MTVRLFAQNREILTKGFPIDSAGSNLMHPIICFTPRCAPPLFEEVKKVKRGGTDTVTICSVEEAVVPTV
jgi:hypothetical protein